MCVVRGTNESCLVVDLNYEIKGERMSCDSGRSIMYVLSIGLMSVFKGFISE